MPRAFLFAVPTSPQQALAQFPDYVDIVAPTYQFLLAHPTFTTLAHDAGLPVHTYTVDREQEMEQLLDLGVDGIFTNRPDVLRRVIDKRGTGVAVKDRPRKPLTAGCKGIAGTVRGPVR